ncbi:MAG: hypothetical protein ACYDGM_04765 [Vulcanimicrobiaceae bacterium]
MDIIMSRGERMPPSGFPRWHPSEDVIAELDQIRSNSTRIKDFVARHGERSASIFARALSASFQPSDEFLRRLIDAPRSDDFAEACSIARAVGRDAAALLPQLVLSYYHPVRIDRYA